MKRTILKIWTAIAICAILVAVGGCEMNSKAESNKIGRDIIYFKDPRTGICFAAIYSYTKDMYSVISITAVPCDKCSELIVERR